MRARRSWHLEINSRARNVMIVGARRFVDRPSACYIHTEPYALFSYMYMHVVVVVVVVACYRAILLIVPSAQFRLARRSSPSKLATCHYNSDAAMALPCVLAYCALCFNMAAFVAAVTEGAVLNKRNIA